MKFKLRQHLETREKLSEIVGKYSIQEEDTFETTGRPDTTINIVLAVQPEAIAEVKLALKRVPEILVKEIKN